MTPAEVNVILNEALEITRQMLAFAREENWAEVARLEGERQQSLMDGLSNADIEKSEEIGKKVQQIIQVDQEMQQLVTAARDDLRDQIIQLNKDKGAIKAYESR
ncbi:MAG: flagellar protein FliT [Gammaproteobacteria bacterium]|nr:flagellar protein FliT [Gammaproteobacteria bacterium]